MDPDESDRYNRETAERFRRGTRSVVANFYPNLIPHAAVTEKCFYTVRGYLSHRQRLATSFTSRLTPTSWCL